MNFRYVIHVYCFVKKLTTYIIGRKLFHKTFQGSSSKTDRVIEKKMFLQCLH